MIHPRSTYITTYTKVHTLFTTGTTNRRLFRDTTQDAINCTGRSVTHHRPVPAVAVRTADGRESSPFVLNAGAFTHNTA